MLIINAVGVTVDITYLKAHAPEFYENSISSPFYW